MAETQAQGVSLEELFKSMVWDAIVKALIARLFVIVPFLGWGPIGLVVTWGLTLLAEKLYSAIKLFINLEMIVLRNAEHERAFTRAGSELYLIARDKGIESEEFGRAREEHKVALAAFVSFA